jgi:hypothetical protein
MPEYSAQCGDAFSFPPGLALGTLALKHQNDNGFQMGGGIQRNQVKQWWNAASRGVREKCISTHRGWKWKGMRTSRTNGIKRVEREVTTVKNGTVKDTEVCGICKGCNAKSGAWRKANRERVNWVQSKKVKQSRYTPWRRLGGEEV